MHVKQVCEHLRWIKPDGGLKLISAKVAKVRMHEDGLIALPPKMPIHNKPRDLTRTPETDTLPKSALLPETLDQVCPFRF